MSATTKIEWTAGDDGTSGKTWNPVRGCSVISPGCVNCYAMKQAHRFSAPGRSYAGLTKQTKAGPQWTGVVRTVESALLEPLTWRKPCRVFVNSMSDLFHESVPDAFIDRVFAVMALSPRHTFQVLTKRPDRMLAWFRSRRFDVKGYAILQTEQGGECLYAHPWPLPNVWLGVSVENQHFADERIPLLLQTPAAVRFVSAEPLLGPINLRYMACREDWHVDALDTPDPSCRLHWVIVGGESGPGARACNVRWVRSVVRQCQQSDTPAFVKQLGAFVVDRNDAGFCGDEPHHWPEVIAAEDRVEHDLDGTRDGYQGAPVRIHLRDKKGGDPSEWPEDLRVREWPGAMR